MTDSKSETQESKPSLVLRTYRPSDFEHVDHLWYSTYFQLVPEGVKSKLASPLTWVIWCGVYAYLFMLVPILLSDMDLPSWSSIALKVFFTVAWTAVSFATLFTLTDRFEVVQKVEAVRQNDLSKPDDYYLHDKGGSSHFWVLLLDGKQVGMVGLAAHDKDINDKSPAMLPAYKKLGAAICRRYGLTVPPFFKAKPEDEGKPRLFAKAHEPNTATLQRLAVSYDYQKCSLSTNLINRALTWANEKGIKQVYASTNEMQAKAADILCNRHGFKPVKKVSAGWFGQNEITWVCDVKDWVENRRDKGDT